MTDNIVQVTQYHIDMGERCYKYRCPIALAVLDWLYNEKSEKADKIVSVTPSDTGIGIKIIYARSPESAEIYYLVNDEIRNVIVKYDDTGQMEPFAFDFYNFSHRQ